MPVLSWLDIFRRKELILYIYTTDVIPFLFVPMNIKKSGSLTSMNNLQCIFCGGKGCKYENYSYWLSQNNTHSAIRGLFSNWVTDDILATARPSSRIIEEFDIIKQFQK